MVTLQQLKGVVTEARPIIERMIADADLLVGLRDVVTAAGGDWSQLKALIKAQIKDEAEGTNTHVQKVLEKAEYATAYADMLGLGNAEMNETSFTDGGNSHTRQNGASA